MAATPRGWVIFDGDNTLWDVESLYDRARHNLCALIESLGGSAVAADTFQRFRDADLYEQYGYRPTRFPQSFVDTLRHCTGRDDQELESRVRTMGQEVFNTTPPLAPDVDEALRRVGGRHFLGLLTAGDTTVQAQRLEAFNRIDQFSAVRVVERKNREVLKEFLDDNQIDPAHTWFVGDSIRSDIEPAVALGIKAIHIDVSNWHPVERGDRMLPAGVHQARSLLEVCKILAC